MKIKKLMLLVLASMAMGVMTGCGNTPQGGDEPGDVEVEKVTISFDANGGTGTMAAVQVDKGSEYTLPANGFTAPVDKHFKSWEVGGEAKEVGAKITVNANTTIKAVWEFNALPAEYDLLEHWEGNQAEEIYTVSKNAAGATVISYTDATGEYSGGWEFVKRSFAYESTKLARFTEYKKIVFTGSMAVTAGTNFVMLKVEGEAGSGNTYEQRFVFAPEEKTYELGLNFISDWTKVQQLLFFTNRSAAESGSGVITLSKFALSKEEVVPENDITGGTMPDVPQGYKPYDTVEAAETAQFSVDYHWGYSTDGHIAAEALDGGIAKFSLEAGEKGEWEYVSSRVKNGKANLQDSGFKRLVFEVKGVAGQTALFKFQSEDNAVNKEKTIKFNGEVQTVELDITAILANEEKTAYMAAIFPQPGAATAVAGTIELTKCFMDKNEVTPDPVNVGKFPQTWLDTPATAALCYDVTLTPAEHKQVIHFEKSAPNWDTVQYKVAPLDGNKLYRRVVVDIVADVATHVLLKAFNAHERWVNLVADEAQHIEYEVPESQVNFDNPFLIFISTNEGDALTGNVTVTGLRLARLTANTEDANGIVRLNRVNNAGDEYTTSVNLDEDLEVEWTKTASGYASIELTVSALNHAALNTMKATLVADHNVHVILKPADNGANEINVALTAGEEQEVTKAITSPLGDEWVAKVIVMICTDGADALSGKVVLKDLRLTDGEHDLPARSAVAPVDGEYRGMAKAKAGNMWPVELFIESGTPTLHIYNFDVHASSMQFYNRTGKVLITSVGAGHVVAKYDSENKAFLNLTTDNETMLNQLDVTYPISLSGSAMCLDCDGTTEELDAQFLRRYNNPWVDDTTNADRIQRETEKVVFGTAMKVRGYTTGRVNLCLKNSIESLNITGAKIKAIGFWVYNTGESNTSIQLFVYKNAAKSSFGQFGTVNAAAGAWSYLQIGRTASALGDSEVLYNFGFTVTNASALIYDNICLYM